MNEFDKRFLELKDKKVEAIYKGAKVVGFLQFAGINSLHGMFQVTLSRTPFWPVDPETIKLYINDRTKVLVKDD